MRKSTNSSDRATVPKSSVASLARPSPGAGAARFVEQALQFFHVEATDELLIDDAPIVEGYGLVAPLPDLGPGDLGGGGVFHQVENSHRTAPAPPGVELTSCLLLWG